MSQRENPFQGSLVALPTPFRNGHIDFDALRALVELQAQSKTNGIVVGGSTGEGASLDAKERCSLLSFCSGVAAGRLPVLAGITATSTREAVTKAQEAKSCGARGLLLSAPIYLRPQQRGILEHFHQVAAATPLPIVLYDIPKRTGVSIELSTLIQAHELCPNIVALKASANLDQLEQAVHAGIEVLCGEDAWIVESLQAGAKGAISVIGNLVPKQLKGLIAEIHDQELAAQRMETLRPLIQALALEPNPVPLKKALSRLGYGLPEVRLPLMELAPEHDAQQISAMQACGLL